jgi:hypothetical protein
MTSYYILGTVRRCPRIQKRRVKAQDPKPLFSSLIHAARSYPLARTPSIDDSTQPKQGAKETHREEKRREKRKKKEKKLKAKKGYFKIQHTHTHTCTRTRTAEYIVQYSTLQYTALSSTIIDYRLLLPP